MGEVVTFWSRRGVDGFRLDMVDFLGKDPDLTDEIEDPDLEPRDLVARARHQLNRPESMTYVRELRDHLTRPADQVLVGELIYHAPVRTLAEWGAGAVDLPLNFRLTFLDLDADGWREFIASYDAACRSTGAWPTYCVSNHDSPRVGRHGDRVRTVLTLLLTLRGTPFLYYGDELGLADARIEPGDGRDLWTTGSRDGSRAPMPWSPEPGAGFTAAGVEPWLVSAPPGPGATVEEQRADPRSTLNLVRRLLALRRERDALRRGELIVLDDLPAGVLGFRRRHPSGDLTVLANLSDTTAELPDRVLVGRPVLATDPDAGSALSRLGPGQSVILDEAAP
jgi:alpha-glucosidase